MNDYETNLSYHLDTHWAPKDRATKARYATEREQARWIGYALERYFEINDEDDEPQPPRCPMCDGPGMELGQLGRLRWYRCRDCGHDFHEEA